MDYVRLGSTGMKVSRLCLGCMSYGSKTWQSWVLEEEDSLPYFRQAVEAGINFFDTADIYSVGRSEEILGNALRALAVPRDDVVVATKVFNPMGPGPNRRGLSRKHIMAAIDDSLMRLDMDYVDLYQIHRFDPDTPIEETLEALSDVVKAGKALYIGASSMYAWQFASYLHLADRTGMSRFVSMQNHYNLVYREEEREMNPLCLKEGIGLMPWSPLARGFLVGNRRRQDFGETDRARGDALAQRMYFQDDDFAVVEAVEQVAQARGTTNVAVALAWLLQRPGVASPIIGATKANHIADALAALELKLTAEEIAALEAPYRPHPILGHGYTHPLGGLAVTPPAPAKP